MSLKLLEFKSEAAPKAEHEEPLLTLAEMVALECCSYPSRTAIARVERVIEQRLDSHFLAIMTMLPPKDAEIVQRARVLIKRLIKERSA